MANSSTKLSGLKEPQQVQRWHDRISVSKRWRDQVADDNNWERFIEELKGKYDVVLGNAQVPPLPEMFAYKDASLANLYYKDPYIAVNAKKNATVQSAYILEAGVNHLWRELKLKRDVELQISDGLFIGHGWNKVGNNTKTSGSGDQLQIVEDSIYANRVSWRDMFMNVGCKQPPRDNLWIAQRIYRPTEDVKEDYGKVAAKLTGSTYPSIDLKFMKNVLFKEDFNYTAIYEIWDARERKIYTIADGLTDRYLEDPRDWPEFLEEFPYQFLSFHEIPDEAYPQSDVGPWEPLVKEKIKIFTMALNHIKRWNRQMVVKTGTFNTQELDKFEKGIDGSILIAKTTGDIQAATKMLDFGTLPPDIYMILDRIDAAIRKGNGQPEFQQGGLTKTGSRTEGELQLIKGGADARTDRKQDRIENHCANIARHLVMQMKNNFDIPFIAKITGKEPPELIQAFKDQGIYDPASQTIKFTKEDIQGDFDVSVKVGSTLPMDKMNRDRVLDQVMQIGAQLASAPSIPPFLAEVIKERVHDYDIKGLEVAFDEQQQATEQMQTQKAQQGDLDSQKIQAETAKRNAQAQNVQIDTLIKGVQAAGKATGVLSPEESLVK
jgi:hypothetical protein